MQYLIWHNEVKGSIDAGTNDQFWYFSNTYGIDEDTAVLYQFSADEYDMFEKIARKLQAVRLDEEVTALASA